MNNHRLLNDWLSGDLRQVGPLAMQQEGWEPRCVFVAFGYRRFKHCWRFHIQRFDGKNHGFRLRFSLKPIQWFTSHHNSWCESSLFLSLFLWCCNQVFWKKPWNDCQVWSNTCPRYKTLIKPEVYVQQRSMIDCLVLFPGTCSCSGQTRIVYDPFTIDILSILWPWQALPIIHSDLPVNRQRFAENPPWK